MKIYLSIWGICLVVEGTHKGDRLDNFLPFCHVFPASFRIQPLKTPYGLPAEQDMAETFINSKGELIVRRLLQPVEPKAIES